MNKPERIPRPKHITSLAINYRQTKNEQLKRQLIQVLLSQYTTNGFQLNGHPLSLQDLSFKYNIDIGTIYKELGEISKTVTGFINSDDLLSSHEALLAMLLESGIRDKGLAAAQLSRMLHSQGDTYKPFISSTVNQAVDLNLKATRNLVDIAQSFIPKNSEVIHMIRDRGQAESLSVTEATEHIRSQAQLNAAPKDAESIPLEGKKASKYDGLYDKHQLSDMPEVRANPDEEQENMVNVKAKQLIEGNLTKEVSQELIDDVESEWEDLK